MTCTKEQLRKAIFGKLRNLRRKLHTQGVSCVHSRSALTHDGDTSGFTITYEASGDNGGVTLRPRISIRTAEGTLDFDYLNFGQGIALIRQLCQTQDGTNGKGSDSNNDTQDSKGYIAAQI